VDEDFNRRIDLHATSLAAYDVTIGFGRYRGGACRRRRGPGVSSKLGTIQTLVDEADENLRNRLAHEHAIVRLAGWVLRVRQRDHAPVREYRQGNRIPERRLPQPHRAVSGGRVDTYGGAVPEGPCQWRLTFQRQH